MQRSTFLAASAALLLAGCASGSSVSQSDLLKNPLYAEYYFNDFADRMANIEIAKDNQSNKPIVENPALLNALRAAKDDALAKGTQARKERDRAGVGTFVPVAEFPSGNVMLVDNMLYTDPVFSVPPGPDLRFVLTTAVDPRDVDFPDASAVLLPIEQNYGASAYAVPAAPNGKQWRSVAVYDMTLKRLYSFAQLSYGPDAR